VIPTSFLPKYQLNTKVWRDGKIGSSQSRALFSWMREGGLPKDSVVAHLCGDSEFLSAYDMNPPVWNEVFHPKYRVKSPYFISNPLFITPEAYSVLKDAEVDYVTIGKSCAYQTYGQQRKTVPPLLYEAVNRLLSDRRFDLIKSTGDEFLFKLK
jgi:hypothetical protein